MDCDDIDQDVEYSSKGPKGVFHVLFNDIGTLLLRV